MIGCISCTPTTCSACDVAANFVGTTNCSCATSYILQGTTCHLCSLYVSQCSQCLFNSLTPSFNVNCTLCIVGFILTNPTTCTNCGNIFNGCLTCTLSSCFTCNTTLNYNSLPGSSGLCSCQTGYTISIQSGQTSCVPCSTLSILGALGSCQACTSNTTCSNCSSSYYVLQT
jgi:hypothetical protein